MVPVLFSRVVLKLMKWLMSQCLLTCIATQKTKKDYVKYRWKGTEVLMFL